MGWDSPLRSSLRLPARPVLDLGARRAELARWTGVWRGLPARGEDPSPAQSRGRPGQLSCGWWSTVTLPDGPAGQPGSGTPRTRLGGACDVHRALAQLTQFVCSQQAPSRERYLQPPPPGPLTLSPTGGRRGRLSESPQTHSQQRQSSPGHRLADSWPPPATPLSPRPQQQPARGQCPLVASPTQCIPPRPQSKWGWPGAGPPHGLGPRP